MRVLSGACPSHFREKMEFRVVPKNPAFAGFAMKELKNSQKMKPESPKGDKKSLSEHTNPKRECAEWTGENSVKTL